MRQAACERYADIRSDAYNVTLKSIAQAQAMDAAILAGVRLQDIDPAALEAAQAWGPDNRLENGGWDWQRAYKRHRTYSSIFPPAVWYHDQLCGLALGWITKGKLYMRMNLIQGSPTNHVLKGNVAYILLTAAEFYADGAGIPMVTIEQPLPAVVPHYQDYGYKLVKEKGETRMVKVLADETD